MAGFFMDAAMCTPVIAYLWWGVFRTQVRGVWGAVKATAGWSRQKLNRSGRIQPTPSSPLISQYQDGRYPVDLP